MSIALDMLLDCMSRVAASVRQREVPWNALEFDDAKRGDHRSVRTSERATSRIGRNLRKFPCSHLGCSVLGPRLARAEALLLPPSMTHTHTHTPKDAHKLEGLKV